MSNTQNVAYPLYGSGLSNVLGYFPKSGSPGDLHYRWTTTKVFPFKGLKYEGWRRFIRNFHPDYLFCTTGLNDGKFSQEDDWAQSKPKSFRLVHEDSATRIYEVTQRALRRPGKGARRRAAAALEP